MGKMVKGRISNTPILLSKSSRFSFLLISDYHRKFNHSGIYYVLHKLKPKYFLLKAYSAVKRVLNECYHCRRFNARPIKVNANDYKEWNINPEKRFFSHCFVDYFGPYFTRYGSEKVKTYGVIFKCVWSKMINVEIVTCADASNFLIAFQNHVYAYGLPTKLFSDSGSNLAKAFAWIRESLDSVEVKAYLDQTGVKVCTFEQYPRGSLNRGIGGIIESGVALVRKLIQGSIRNNILDFQQFSHVIKQCICYANKKPLSIESLRGENPDDQFQIFSPEFLKFGYETAVLEVNGGNESDDWMFEDLEVKEEMKKMLEVKEKLRNSYHSEFLYGLLNQATKEKDKYVPVLHNTLAIGDVVLIKDPYVKAPNYPLAKVLLETTVNSLGEITQVLLKKGNGSLVRRDISAVIFLVRGRQPEQEVGVVENDFPVDPSISCRPKRQAALVGRDTVKSWIDAGDV